MKNMAAPQTSTATDCDLGLVMRGTLVASAMVQKLRIPSTKTRLDHELHTMEEHCRRNLQIAATIWTSSPSWFWNPPVK